eukprot:471938-Prymnesium_polylepis.1
MASPQYSCAVGGSQICERDASHVSVFSTPRCGVIDVALAPGVEYTYRCRLPATAGATDGNSTWRGESGTLVKLRLRRSTT